MKDIAGLQTTLLVLTSSPSPPHWIFAFPKSNFIDSRLAEFFIVYDIYCLNGSPDLYKSTTCWGEVVSSKGLACCIAPKALAVIPRTRKTTATIKLPEVFLIIISALINKRPLIAVSKFNILFRICSSKGSKSFRPQNPIFWYNQIKKTARCPN